MDGLFAGLPTACTTLRRSCWESRCFTTAKMHSSALASRSTLASSSCICTAFTTSSWLSFTPRRASERSGGVPEWNFSIRSSVAAQATASDSCLTSAARLRMARRLLFSRQRAFCARTARSSARSLSSSASTLARCAFCSFSSTASFCSCSSASSSLAFFSSSRVANSASTLGRGSSRASCSLAMSTPSAWARDSAKTPNCCSPMESLVP
mmetsp:Transcript_7562/g.31987  ORF Transcript_7562/g.31987 Transcript_7562/m.31987 type:complete len:210 (-) Transcript_7562:1901-2530(-)